MWVIYNEETGYEIDRIESNRLANLMLVGLNDNEFGNRYAKRWED